MRSASGQRLQRRNMCLLESPARWIDSSFFGLHSFHRNASNALVKDLRQEATYAEAVSLISISSHHGAKTPTPVRNSK